MDGLERGPELTAFECPCEPTDGQMLLAHARDALKDHLDALHPRRCERCPARPRQRLFARPKPKGAPETKLEATGTFERVVCPFTPGSRARATAHRRERRAEPRPRDGLRLDSCAPREPPNRPTISRERKHSEPHRGVSLAPCCGRGRPSAPLSMHSATEARDRSAQQPMLTTAFGVVRKQPMEAAPQPRAHDAQRKRDQPTQAARAAVPFVKEPAHREARGHDGALVPLNRRVPLAERLPHRLCLAAGVGRRGSLVAHLPNLVLELAPFALHLGEQLARFGSLHLAATHLQVQQIRERHRRPAAPRCTHKIWERRWRLEAVGPGSGHGGHRKQRRHRIQWRQSVHRESQASERALQRPAGAIAILDQRLGGRSADRQMSSDLGGDLDGWRTDRAAAERSERRLLQRLWSQMEFPGWSPLSCAGRQH